MISGILLMFANLLRGLRQGAPAPMNPWDATTLEWTVPSPPPMENFEEIPFVTKGPYDREGLKESSFTKEWKGDKAAREIQKETLKH
jgi:heme/copper-type cytochrome/quinol oxidase subunit 1